MIEVAGCKHSIIKAEIWDVPKFVDRYKTLRTDGLPDEVYLRQSCMFVPLLYLIYNNWLKNGNIPLCFTKSLINLLGKENHGGDRISNY